MPKTSSTFKKPLVSFVIRTKTEYNPSYALNLGITQTKGKYIGILSGHSMPISKTWLKDGLANFKNDKAAGVTGFYTQLPIGYFSQTVGRILFKFENFYRLKRKEFCTWLTNTNALIRKDLWQKYPFDEKLPECEDYDWGLEMLVRGYNIIKEPKFSVFHSHFYLNRPGYRASLPRWRKICAKINKRQRPRKSFTRLKI